MSNEKIDNLKIHVDRTIKIKAGDKIKEVDNLDFLYWERHDDLEIDRKSEKLIQHQQLMDGIKINREYYVQEGMGVLLDRLSSNKNLLSEFYQNKEKIKENEFDKKSYKIEITFDNGKKIIHEGIYTKKGILKDFKIVVDEIWDFISFYGMGDILDHGYVDEIELTKEK